MRKLMLFLIALIAVVTFIRAFDIAAPGTAGVSPVVAETVMDD